VLLPDDYRAFLLRTNGGRPTPDVIDIEGLAGSPTDIQVFLTLGGAIESATLDWAADHLWEHLPEAHLPIAYDSLGGLFTLDTATVTGTVRFVPPFSYGEGHLWVARSFSELLQLLRHPTSAEGHHN
jgi:hypothetical protein